MPDWRTAARSFLDSRLQTSSPLAESVTPDPAPTDWRASALGFLRQRETMAEIPAPSVSHAPDVPPPATPAVDISAAPVAWTQAESAISSLANRRPLTPTPFNPPRFIGLDTLAPVASHAPMAPTAPTSFEPERIMGVPVGSPMGTSTMAALTAAEQSPMTFAEKRKPGIGPLELPAIQPQTPRPPKEQEGPLGLADFIAGLVEKTPAGAAGAIAPGMHPEMELPAYQISQAGVEKLPFIGSVPAIADAYNIIRAARRVRDGQATEADNKVLDDYVAKDEEAKRRGTTMAYEIANIAAQIPAFGMEFMATGGVFSGVKELVTEAVAKRLVTSGAKAGAEFAAERAAIKAAGYTAGAAAQTLALPHRIVAEAGRRQTPTSDTVKAGKDALSDWNDDFVPALAKAVPDQFVEIFSERTGGLIEGAGARLAKLPVVARIGALKEAVLSRWLKLHPDKGVREFFDQVRTTSGWNGVLGEMFEERVGEVMRAAQPYLREPGQPQPSTIRMVTGEPTAETLPGENPRAQAARELGRQLVVEAAAFAIPGAVRGLAELATRERPAREPGPEPVPMVGREQHVPPYGTGRVTGATPPSPPPAPSSAPVAPPAPATSVPPAVEPPPATTGAPAATPPLAALAAAPTADEKAAARSEMKRRMQEAGLLPPDVVPQEARDAVQEPGATPVHARETPNDRGAVGQGIRPAEAPATARQAEGEAEVGESSKAAQEISDGVLDSIGKAERVQKKARLGELKADIQAFAKKDGLTRQEAERYHALMREAADIRFDLARPLTIDKVRPQEQRGSLPPEIVVAAHRDLLLDRGIYTAISDASFGVWHDSDTAVDTIVDGKNPDISARQLYDAFSETRDLIRSTFGDTVTLYRAVGKQKAKATQNWATTEAYAKQFGENVISKEIPVNDIVAVNVGPTGGYEEVIVGTVRESPKAAQGKAESDLEAYKASLDAINATVQGEPERFKAAADAELAQASAPQPTPTGLVPADIVWHEGPRAAFRRTATGNYELKFSAKPTPVVLDGLKKSGWRWSPPTKVWYHKPGPGIEDTAYNVTGVARTAVKPTDESVTPAAPPKAPETAGEEVDRRRSVMLPQGWERVGANARGEDVYAGPTGQRAYREGDTGSLVKQKARIVPGGSSRFGTVFVQDVRFETAGEGKPAPEQSRATTGLESLSNIQLDKLAVEGTRNERKLAADERERRRQEPSEPTFAVGDRAKSVEGRGEIVQVEGPDELGISRARLMLDATKTYSKWTNFSSLTRETAEDQGFTVGGFINTKKPVTPQVDAPAGSTPLGVSAAVNRTPAPASSRPNWEHFELTDKGLEDDIADYLGRSEEDEPLTAKEKDDLASLEAELGWRTKTLVYNSATNDAIHDLLTHIESWDKEADATTRDGRLQLEAQAQIIVDVLGHADIKVYRAAVGVLTQSELSFASAVLEGHLGVEPESSTDLDRAITRLRRDAIEAAGQQRIDFETPVAPATFAPPTTAQTKAKAAPTKYEATKAALDAEEDALWAKVRAKMSQAPTGIDPELAEIAVKLIGVYAKRGVNEFGEAVRLAVERVGRPMVSQMAIYLDAGWSLLHPDSAEVSTHEVLTTLPAEQTLEMESGDENGPIGSGQEGESGDDRRDGRGDVEAGVRPGVGADSPAPPESRPGPRVGQRGTLPGRTRKPRTGNVETTPALAPELYRITEHDAVGTGSAKQRVTANLAAIRIVKEIDAENRRATPEEQAILVRYVGWGGLPRIFEYWKNDGAEADDTTSEYWRKQDTELRELLTDEEYRQARNSTQNAHYTSPIVINAMWEAVQHLGVKSGSALETSAGVGHFTGMTPDALRSMAWAMIEKDSITAAIAKALYPGAFVQHSPFEKATLPDNHFALAISNVPFGNIPITDPAWTGPAFMRHRIHNYFFGKALDKVAPGGLVAFITTQGTLDSRENEQVRKYLASRADFLGAIRLPYTAFKKNAGTEVVTDMVFLRKRHEGEEPKHAGPWFESKRVLLPNKDGVEVEQWVNEYILKHPKMVLGTHSSAGKQRAADQYTVEPTGDLAEQLKEAIRRLPKNVISLMPAKESLAAFTQQQAPIGTRPYEFLIHEGRLAQNVDGKAVETDLSGADEARVRAILPIRTAVRNVYDLMAAGASDADVTAAQKALATAYDGFVKKHGFVSLRQNHWAFREDPDFPLVLSLEDYDAERDTATKTPIFTKRTIAAEQKLKTADTPDKALYISLGETGRIDLDRIGELLGVSADQAASDLEGAGLLIKTPSGYQLPAIYLSGNVRVKLREAESAAAIDPTYQPAVDRLNAIIPADLEPYKIDVKLGAPWVPLEAVQAFVESVTTGQKAWSVTYNPTNAQWAIEGKAADRHSRFETPDVDTKTLLLDALNDRRRRIRETHDGVTTDNRAATALARQRKADIHKAFAAWLLKEDQERSQAMSRLYNDIYSANVDPVIDGDYLTFPGMADYWRDVMAAHQKSAAARVLLLGNTYLDHVVGSGKTLTMVSALMELKRLGNARKPMMVVPNHLISQTPGQFLQYYPNAKILVAYKEDLEEANRKRFTARIAAGDWDAVIMPFSSFVKVSMSVEAEIAYQREILDEVEAAILEAEMNDIESQGRHERRQRGGSRKKSPTVKNLERTRDTIQAKLDKLADRPKDDLLTFEQLGVDALFVDEAHGFKNLYFPTRQQAAGIPQGTIVQRATDLYLKARYINQQSHYRNLVLASGTPVSNSLAEMFVAQKLLQDPMLDRSGIGTLDAWLAQFGLIETKTELAPSGTGMKARAVLTKLRNAPDLAKLFRQVFDVKTIDDLPDLKRIRPKVKGGGPEIVEVPISAYQSAALMALAHRADHLDPRDKRTDNMAMITTDGRMLMLDPRLLDRTLPEAPGSKMSVVAEKVAEIWKATKDVKGTQLVFLDSGTPGSEVRPQFKETQDPNTGNTIRRPLTDREKVRGFDLYADLKKKLIKLGVKANEIAFIHDIDKLPEKQQDGARQSLFRNVRTGVVRVLVGSTEKMGTGMNVQDRGVALHNVDATWTPAGLEQRIGRFLRQGNIFFQNDPEGFELRILNYLTVGSGTQFGFDSYMWQLNERKAKGIAQLFDGTSTARSVSTDMGATALTTAQMKAIATGNPLVIDLGQAMDTVEQLELTQQGFDQSQREADWGLDRAKNNLTHEEALRNRAEQTAAVIEPHEPGTPLKGTINGADLEGHKVIGEAILAAAKKVTTASEETPGAWKTWQDRMVLGTVRGMTVALEGNGKTIPHVTLRHPQDVPQKYYENREDRDYTSVRLPLLMADIDGPGGMNWAPPVSVMMKGMNALDEIQLDGAGGSGHWRSRYIEELEGKIASYQSILGQSFDQQGELDAAYAKVEELSIALGLPVPQRGQQEEVIQDDTDDEPADDSDIDAMPMAGWRPRRHMMTLPARSTVPSTGAGPTPAGPQMNRDEILAAFRTFFSDVPVNTRRFSQRALGIYKPDVTAIRTRVSKDLQVILHELGHHVDRAVMQIRPARATGANRAVAVELETLGAVTTPPSKMKDRSYKRKEGAAEYLRLWFTEPDVARQQAPAFTALFERYLGDNAALGDFFREQQAQIQGLLAMTPEEELEERIDWNGEPGKFGVFRDWVLGTTSDPRTGLQKLNDALNDDNLPFLRLEQAMGAGLPLGQYAVSAYAAFRMLAGTSGQAQTYLEDAIRRPDGTIMGPGFLQAVKDVLNRQDYKKFVAYVVARRAQEYEEQGLETGIRPTSVQGVMDAPVPDRFREAAEKVTTYWDTLLQWAVERGYLSDASAQAMRARNTRYVPWERVMDAADQAFRGPGTKKQNTPQAIKARTGSARRIVDPIVTSIKNTFAFVRTVEENAARLKLVDVVQEEGGARFLERVSMKQVATRFNLDRVRQAILAVLAANGVHVGEDLPNDVEFDALVTVYTPAVIAMGDSRIITVLRDGKREWYEVHDDAIWETLVNAQPQGPRNVVTKLATGAASLLRRTATSTLSFFSRNLVRDTIDAKTKAGYHHTFLKSLAAAGLIIKNDESWQRFRASKAAQASIVSVDRNYAKNEVKKFQHSRLRRTLDVTVFNPFEGLRALAELSDNATRLQSFLETHKKLVAEGITGEEAETRSAFTSRESTQDFAKMGSVIRRYNRYEAFLGARVGGWTRIATELGNPDKRATYAFKAFLYGILPGLILWWLHKDDPEYDELPGWERAAYWHVPKPGGGWIRLPRPFDVGDAGNVLEAYLDWAVDHDPDAVQRLPFAGAGKQDLLKTFLALSPTAVLPVLEATANYDTFRKRPIVSPFDLDLPLEQQYSQWTSTFSKRVGPAIGIAPAMLDHIIYGYTSATGQFIAQTISRAEEAAGWSPPSPSRGLRDVPGVGAFVGQRATSQASSLETFRQRRDSLELYARTINRYVREGKIEKAQATLASRPTGSSELAGFRRADAQIRLVTKAVGAIRRREDLTAREKRELYDRLYDSIIDLARFANGDASLPVRHPKIDQGLLAKMPPSTHAWLVTPRLNRPAPTREGAAGGTR